MPPLTTTATETSTIEEVSPPQYVDGMRKLPVKKMGFTVGDLKKAIPAHCFERSTLTSLRYTFVDLAFVALFYYLSTFIDHPSVPQPLRYVLWPLYWVCQGNVCTGLWVIAHECGHRAFSDNIFFGDIVGLILHSALLVPYHPWRISHAKHHRSTNDMDRDEVFVPYTKSELNGARDPTEYPPIVSVTLRLIHIFKMLVFGWPTYLMTHATGRKYGRRTNHYEPSSPLFGDDDRISVIVSDIALLAVLSTLGYFGTTRGWTWLFCVYGVPYLIVNHWLVLITDLQHTDVHIPHFRDDEWNWLRGALCTVDRDYGFLNIVFHHIGDTHVAHHIFHTMPHYHCQEATEVLKPILGDYYLRTNDAPGVIGIAQALWRTTTKCRYVDDEGKVLWFKQR